MIYDKTTHTETRMTTANILLRAAGGEAYLVIHIPDVIYYLEVNYLDIFRTGKSREDFTPLELTMDQNYLCSLWKRNESAGNMLWLQPHVAKHQTIGYGP